MQDNTNVVMLNASLIIPNKYQPRKVFNDAAIDSLATSIKNYGIINPILVRKKDDKYEIIAGERRFRAANKIGMTEVPVIIKNATEQQMAELALIENIQRQELTPIEEAKSYEEIMRIGNQTQQSLANKLGKSQSYIANKIRLLSLPEEIQNAVTNKKISERHARCLINIEDKEKQLELLNKIIEEKLTVKDTERIINENQINEEELKQAISDIMKSLNIKEEEKEDDNMNNGNFFPNFDNNNAANNNASLNMMNIQSMNQVPIAPEPEVVMPTVNQQPQEAATMPMAEQTTMQSDPSANQPIFDQNVPTTPSQNIAINNNMNLSNDITTQPMINNNDANIINDTPLFGVQQPIEPPIIQQPQPSIPMVDEPLFNPNITMPGTNQVVSPIQGPQMVPPINPVEPPVTIVEQQTPTPNTFEVPVTNQQIIESPITINRFEELQNLLSANGYTYRHYSNETDNCIIIEIPKN